MTDPREPREPVEGDEELAEPAAEDGSTEPVTGEEGMEVDEAGAVDQAGAGDDAASMEPQGPPSTAGTTPSETPPLGAAVPSSAQEAPPSSRTGKPSGGGSGAVAGDVSELPYVDDPVSKWWVGLIVAVFVVLFVWAVFLADAFDGLFESAAPEPAASPTPVVTASPDATPTPLLTVAPSEAAETPEPATPAPATPAPPSEEPGTPVPATQAPSTPAPAPSGTSSIPAATGAAASPAG